MIPLAKTKIHEEAIENVVRVLRSNWPGMGPEVETFEKEFATYLGAEHAIALTSGTEALRLAVWAAQFSPGNYIITTPNTFVSSNHVLLQAGLVPIFADINPNTGSIDPDSIYRCLRWNFPIARHPQGLMLVHFAGMPCDLEEIYSIAADNDLTIIHDCAHACGAEYQHKKLGASGAYNCFSLHAVKPLAIGDGGVFTTDDEDIACMIRKGRWLGIDKSTHERSKDDLYSWEYNVALLGYKSHMCDVMAAVARGQLPHLPSDATRRMELASLYREKLAGVVQLMDCPEDRLSSNHLFVVRFKDSDERRKVMVALKEHGISYGHHYTPNYKYRMYQQFLVESKKGMELYSATALSLPLHLYLTDEDVDFICKTIKEAVG